MKTKSDLDKFVTMIADYILCSALPCYTPCKHTPCKHLCGSKACHKIVRAALLKAAAPEVVREFVKRVNARAEAAILDTGVVEGAHHRAIEAELQEVEREQA